MIISLFIVSCNVAINPEICDPGKAVLGSAASCVKWKVRKAVLRVWLYRSDKAQSVEHNI